MMWGVIENGPVVPTRIHAPAAQREGENQPGVAAVTAAAAAQLEEPTWLVWFSIII